MAAPPQPIHPSVRDSLDPQYITFHEKYVQDFVPNHRIPWSAATHRNGKAPAGSAVPVKVGSTKDYSVEQFQVRVHTPEGGKPAGGWPVMVWYHGGGCVLGGISSEESYCTQVCAGARCVVVSVDYRMAPENPFPASTDDTILALQWVVREGPSLLHIDTSRLAVGGLSAGGGLATVAALTAPTLSPPINILLQVLVVPVTDQTATAEEGGVWHSRRDVPGLTPERMTWYRHMYLPKEELWSDWRASPRFAEDALFEGAKHTKTWIAVADHDILCDEALAYAEQLRSHGFDVDTVVVPGATHALLVMDGWMDASKKLVADSLIVIRKALGTTPA